MAVRNINEARVNKPKKLHKVHILIIGFAVIFFSYVFAVSVMNYVQAADYDKQAEEINAMAVSVSEESSEIYEILSDENHDAYYEKIAREEYGYCMPGEKVYYNSSFGE